MIWHILYAAAPSAVTATMKATHITPECTFPKKIGEFMQLGLDINVFAE
jgi:hypothetical protein